MKKIFPFLSLSILLTSFPVIGQVKYQLINTSLGPYVQIGNVHLLTDYDPNVDGQGLKFWNSKLDDTRPKIIDTVGFTPYSSNIYVYGSKKVSDYLIFWVTDYESTSDILLYYLSKDSLTKIGSLPIQRVYDNKDDVIYPIDKIKIYEQNNEIVINLLIPFEYNIGQDKWLKFNPKQTYFTINKTNKKILRH